jgi:hypothetical protein
MDVFTTHGAFSWSELTTSDVAGARQFYGKLFGWQFRDMEMANGSYTTCQVGESSVAGMMKQPEPDTPVGWGCYVTVRNIDDTVKQVTALGGKVLMPPFEVPTVGRMAVIQDPQGAMLSVITYAAQK